MSEKRIDRRPDLFALPRHDIHRIMQKCVPDLRAGLGHERRAPAVDVASALAKSRCDRGANAKSKWHRSLPSAVGPKVRQSILALLLGMHAAIERRSPARSIRDSNSWRRSRSDASGLMNFKRSGSLPAHFREIKQPHSASRRCPRGVMVLTIFFFPQCLYQRN